MILLFACSSIRFSCDKAHFIAYLLDCLEPFPLQTGGVINLDVHILDTLSGLIVKGCPRNKETNF